MNRLFSFTMSVAGFEGEEIEIHAFTSQGDGATQELGELSLKVSAPEQPVDLADWMRQILVAAAEAL